MSKKIAMLVLKDKPNRMVEILEENRWIELDMFTWEYGTLVKDIETGDQILVAIDDVPEALIFGDRLINNIEELYE